MPKTSKIHVLIARYTCHIPLDPADPASVQAAAASAQTLLAAGKEIGQTTMVARLSRVPAPEPASDGLDIPPALVRTGAAK